jgi:hypothetical protein
MAQTAPEKWHGLFALAILLLLVAAAGLYLGQHDFRIRTLGLASVMLSVLLSVRVARIRAANRARALLDQHKTLS